MRLVDLKTNVPKDGRGLKTLGIAREGKVANPQGKDYLNPRPLDGKEVAIAPGNDPREELARWMTAPDNPFLARALVNRYWAHFLGRGIVDPIDDMRVSNPPRNPALLDALTKDFIEHRFDLKHLVRTICTSKTYQLSSTPNAHNQKDRQNFARYYPKRLPAEVLLDAVDQVTAVPTRYRAAGLPAHAGVRAAGLPAHAGVRTSRERRPSWRRSASPAGPAPANANGPPRRPWRKVCSCSARRKCTAS